MTKLFLMAFVFVSVSACNRKQEVLIENVSRDTVIIIKTNVTNPTLLRLSVKGFINDSISINHVTLYSGSIDTTLRFDCYSKDFAITYKANKVNKGNLLIRYAL